MPRTEGKPFKMYERNISKEKSPVSGGVTEIVEFKTQKETCTCLGPVGNFLLIQKKFLNKTMDILHYVKLLILKCDTLNWWQVQHILHWVMQ